MDVHLSTDAGMRGSQGTASLKSTISAKEVWWCVVSYSASDKLNWCTSGPATLTPLDTYMWFWHMLPAMNLHRKVVQHDNARPHSARATVDFLANQERYSAPLAV